MEILYIALVVAAIVCAFLAIRAKRMLVAALWLAATSALVAIIFFALGAYQVAVIELSVGAGLVTILFVFAISLAGEDVMTGRRLVPRPLTWALVILSVGLLGWMNLSAISAAPQVTEPSFADMLWQQRGLDVLVQIVLIFAGVLGLLGLLSEAKAPAKEPVTTARAIKTPQPQPKSQPVPASREVRA